jgi:hypothetical protein
MSFWEAGIAEEVDLRLPRPELRVQTVEQFEKGFGLLKWLTAADSHPRHVHIDQRSGGLEHFGHLRLIDSFRVPGVSGEAAWTADVASLEPQAKTTSGSK